MNKLGEQHITFLRICDSQPWKKHSSDLPLIELQQMVSEGLLIKYSGSPAMYAITKIGTQVSRSFGDSPDLVKIAIDFVVSRGYELEAAEQIVKENGAEVILKSMADLKAQESTGQKEIKVPINEQGKPEIKYRG